MEAETTSLWMLADSWQEYIDINRAFLRGETNASPYHSGPVYDETCPLVDDLIEMHDYGLMTFESQPALKEGPGKAARQCCADHGFVHSQQRAFISFLVPTEPEISEAAIKAFCDNLLADDRFHTSVLRSEGHCRRGCCMRAPALQSNFPEQWETHLRIYAATRVALKEKTLQPFRHIDPWCNAILAAFLPRIYMASMKPLIIHVLAKGWEPIKLAPMVVEAAQRAGLEPVYTEDSGDEGDDGDEDGMLSN